MWKKTAPWFYFAAKQQPIDVMLRWLVFICMVSGCLSLCAANTVPALEREITLTFTNEKLNSALNKIQEQTGLIFSYSSSILNNAPAVSLRLKQKTVREALALMLPKSISFKAKNNYIILKEKPVEKNPEKTRLSGYIYDKNTDKKLPNVTIYDKTTLQSVTTNEYGYYSISLPKEDQCLTVNKENYRDTCISLTYLKDGPLTNISIDPVNDTVSRRDSAYWRQKIRNFSQSTNDLFRRFKGYINTINVKDTLSRNFQVSLLPFLGTNGLMAGNVYNRFSLNIFGGYSRGTHLLELGGFFNIDREKVTGLQGAGFFNIAGDTMHGVQLAGSFNVTGKCMIGFQGAGFLNLNVGDCKGFQAAGMANLNARGHSGVSFAGLLNANRLSARGLQVAGMLNVNADTLAGTSMAGFINLSWYGKRSREVAGMMNSTRSGDHNVQIAGFLNNTARGSSNLQVAAFFNRTHVLKGLQLSMFNYADSASGVPIGLLSFVKKGLHQLEVSADELFYANAALRTGVPAFYNILSVGVQPGSGGLWSLGYGIGSSLRLSKKLRGEATASSHHVSVGKFYFATSELYKFYLGVEYRLAPKISLAAGPTFNLYWSDVLLPGYESNYSNIAPYYSFNKALANDFNLKGWFGARVAFRFF